MPRRFTAPNIDGQGVPTDIGYQRCRIIDSAGRRCRFPGTIHLTTAPTADTGTCRLHHLAPGSAIDAVVAESERWFEARRAGTDVPLTYKRWDGVEVPGFPDQAQLERALNEAARPKLAARAA